MKFLTLSLMIFLLAACSSAPKDTQVKNNDDYEEEDLSAKAPGQIEVQTEETKQTVAPTQMSDLYKKFSEAKKNRQYKHAQDIAADILARQPQDIKVLNGLAVMAIEQSKYDLAKLLIGKILAKEPNNSAAYNNLALIELKSDNLRQALGFFKKAIDIDFANKSAHANLGQIYLQYRNYPNAVSELRAAQRYGDQSLETTNNLAVALALSKQYQEAGEVYETALAKDANNTSVLFNYSILLVEHERQPQKALKFLNKLRFSNLEPGILERVNGLIKKAEAQEAKGRNKGVTQ